MVTSHRADLVVRGYLLAWCWAHPPLILFAGGVVFCVDPILQMNCSFFRGDLSRLCLVGIWCGSRPVCLSLCPASGFTLW